MQHTVYKYFHEVARHRSIRKAAEKLNVAASAVSRQIALLEHSLGVPLIERLPRGIQLTYAGQILYRYVQQDVSEQQRALGWIEEIKGGQRGHVRVAAIEGFVPNFLPRVLKSFRERHPHVGVEIFVVGTDRVTDLLRDYECEIGLVFQPKDISMLVSAAEMSSPFSAVMRPDHQLATRKSVSIREVAQYPVVLTEASYSSRHLIDVAVRPANVSLNVAVEMNSIEGAKGMARAGVGIVFLPAVAVERERLSRELVAVPLCDPEFSEAKLMVLIRATRRLTVAADRLLSALVAAFRAGERL